MPYDDRSLDLAFAAPGAPRLSVVLAAVSADAALSPLRRRDLVSAVRRVAAALDRAPADIPADPLWLRPRLGKIAPAALGLSQKTWTNILSDFRAALASAGATAEGRGRPAALPSEWTALRDALTLKRHRIGLSRFMRFCANLGVAPEAVNDEALAGFHAALERSELRKDPATLVRETATFWNQAGETVPGWPVGRLTVPDRRNRVALSMETFPPSFRADADAYLKRLAVADLTDPDAPPRALEPETIAFRRGQIARFASALVHRGRDPETIAGLADLVEPAAAREGLRYFLDRNGGKPSGAIHNLAALLKSIAKWGCGPIRRCWTRSGISPAGSRRGPPA